RLAGVRVRDDADYAGLARPTRVDEGAARRVALLRYNGGIVVPRHPHTEGVRHEEGRRAVLRLQCAQLRAGELGAPPLLRDGDGGLLERLDLLRVRDDVRAGVLRFVARLRVLRQPRGE